MAVKISKNLLTGAWSYQVGNEKGKKYPKTEKPVRGYESLGFNITEMDLYHTMAEKGVAAIFGAALNLDPSQSGQIIDVAKRGGLFNGSPSEIIRDITSNMENSERALSAIQLAENYNIISHDAAIAAKKDIEYGNFEAANYAALSDNATANEQVLNEYVSRFDTNLIVFPSKLTEDVRLRDSEGSVFLHGIFQQSVEAMSKKYSQDLDEAEAMEVDPIIYKAMLLSAQKNSALFKAQSLDCVLSLTEKKLTEIINKIEADTSKMEANKETLANLRAERDAIVDKRKNTAILIQTIKNAQRSADHAFYADAHEKIDRAIEYTFSRSVESENLDQARAASDLELSKYKLYIESCRIAMDKMSKDQRHELHKLVVSSVGLSEDALDIILSGSGEIPKELEAYIPKVVSKIKDSAFTKFNENTISLCSIAKTEALKEIIVASKNDGSLGELMTEQDFDELFVSDKGTISKHIAGFKDKVVGKISKAAFADFYAKASAHLQQIKDASQPTPGSGE